MDVQGLNPVGSAAPVRGTQVVTGAPPAAEAAPLAPQDQVEISSLGKMLDEASRTPGVREERLAQIRAEIAAGSYDTPEKLEVALSRMLEQITAGDG